LFLAMNTLVMASKSWLSSSSGDRHSLSSS
jgi:hypothetical protein